MSRHLEEAEATARLVFNKEKMNSDKYHEDLLNRSIVHGRVDISIMVYLLDSLIGVMKSIRLILVLILLMFIFWCGREAQNNCFSLFIKTHFSYIFQLYKVI